MPFALHGPSIVTLIALPPDGEELICVCCWNAEFRDKLFDEKENE